MRMFVVYESPKDFPGKWVVREWSVGEPQGLQWADKSAVGPGVFARISPHAVCDSLGEAQATIPSGFTLTYPNAADDPAIKEVWL